MAENRWGVWSIRSGNSVAGYAESWLKQNGERYEGTKSEAKARAAQLNGEKRSSNVSYAAKEIL